MIIRVPRPNDGHEIDAEALRQVLLWTFNDAVELAAPGPHATGRWGFRPCSWIASVGQHPPAEAGRGCVPAVRPPRNRIV